MKAGHEAIGRALFSPFEIDATDKDNILAVYWQ